MSWQVGTWDIKGDTLLNSSRYGFFCLDFEKDEQVKK
jgi:hypothetical protein